MADENGNDAPQEMHSSRRRRPRWLDPRVLGAAAIAGAGAGVLALVPPLVNVWPEVKAPSTSGHITSPSDPLVGKNFDMQGVYKDLQEGDVIWCVYQRQDDGMFYPMLRPATLSEDTFDCSTLYLGNQEKSDVGARFKLMLLSVSPAGVDEIEEAHIDKQPLREIPDGAHLVDTQDVVRK